MHPDIQKAVDNPTNIELARASIAVLDPDTILPTDSGAPTFITTCVAPHGLAITAPVPPIVTIVPTNTATATVYVAPTVEPTNTAMPTQPATIAPTVVTSCPDALPLRLNGLPYFQLSEQEGSQDVAHHITRSDINPGIFIDLPTKETAPIGSFFSDDLGAFSE